MIDIRVERGDSTYIRTATMVGLPVVTPDGHYGIISKVLDSDDMDLAAVMYWCKAGDRVWQDSGVYRIDNLEFDVQRMEGER